MEENNLEYIKQNFQIHYYFDDNSHSMNAFVRNAMEKELLNLISEVGKTLNIDMQIDSEVKKEGGLIDTFNLTVVLSVSGAVAIYFRTSINQIITYYLTDGFYKNKETILNNALKEEEIKRSKIQTEKEELELKIFQEYNALATNHKLDRNISNFYKKAEKYEKIKKIGYQINNSNELIIEREQFKSFIIEENKDVETIEEAEIEIISPVLKEGKYKWRGIYNGEKIDFSMGDSGFKNAVIGQEYNFINGTTINCQLEISKTFDDYGEEIKTSYRVKKVYSVQANDIFKITKFGQKRRKQKEESLEPTLFDFTKDTKD
ncbi:TPA: hypothetical protein RXN25_000996 [Campylobacter coli]|nr:hypothetical protein [Campylobacter coli]HEH4740588.1 hypothetical protein [Campylobacter coli]